MNTPADNTAPANDTPITEEQAVILLQNNMKALDETTTLVGTGVDGVVTRQNSLLARIDELVRNGSTNSTEAILANVQEAIALNGRLTTFAGILKGLAVDPANPTPEPVPTFEDQPGNPA